MPDIPITQVSQSVYAKISLTPDSPEGFLAVAPQKHAFINDFSPKARGVHIIAVSLEEPANLGAIFRLADNAAASAVIVCDSRTDIFHPQVIRSSLGTFFSVKIIESSAPQAISWCQRHHINILATSPNTGKNYTEANMTSSLAIVLGSEYAGLTPTWLKNSDQIIKIPMFGQANSLTVSATAAVLLYEALRQRQP